MGLGGTKEDGVHVDPDLYVDADMDVEATVFVGVLVDPAGAAKVPQNSHGSVPSLGRVEAVLAGCPVELEAVGMRGRVGWGRSSSTAGGRSGATGCTGA